MQNNLHLEAYSDSYQAQEEACKEKEPSTDAARYQVRVEAALETQGLQPRRTPDPGALHRREHRRLHNSEYSNLERPAISRCWPAGDPLQHISGCRRGIWLER